MKDAQAKEYYVVQHETQNTLNPVKGMSPFEAGETAESLLSLMQAYIASDGGDSISEMEKLGVVNLIDYINCLLRHSKTLN
mgnify:CR=1 FL=1